MQAWKAGSEKSYQFSNKVNTIGSAEAWKVMWGKIQRKCHCKIFRYLKLNFFLSSNLETNPKTNKEAIFDTCRSLTLRERKQKCRYFALTYFFHV